MPTALSAKACWGETARRSCGHSSGWGRAGPPPDTVSGFLGLKDGKEFVNSEQRVSLFNK